ncbi:MAG: type II toxin-antitoxin system prevent-host-death family antitoxin [Bifidobacteriaceae bacterium]|nr:type II toxin-antitoxin system prevent-host-death family antitoxin [Bifidobacteriaceae bacterium]
MTLTVNVADAKARLSALLAAAEDGAEVYIARAGTPVVRLVPVEHRRPRVFDSWPGQFDAAAREASLAPLDEGDLADWGLS